MNLFERLAELAGNAHAVTTTASDDDYFGPQKQVHVTTLAMTPELQALHNHIVILLKSFGATFDEPRYKKKATGRTQPCRQISDYIKAMSSPLTRLRLSICSRITT